MTADSERLFRLRPMRGFFAQLSSQQKAAVLAYRGSDAVAPMHPAGVKATASSVNKAAKAR